MLLVFYTDTYVVVAVVSDAWAVPVVPSPKPVVAGAVVDVVAAAAAVRLPIPKPVAGAAEAVVPVAAAKPGVVPNFRAPPSVPPPRVPPPRVPPPRVPPPRVPPPRVPPPRVPPPRVPPPRVLAPRVPPPRVLPSPPVREEPRPVLAVGAAVAVGFGAPRERFEIHLCQSRFLNGRVTTDFSMIAFDFPFATFCSNNQKMQTF